MVTFVFIGARHDCHKFQSFDLVHKIHIQFTMCANTKLTANIVEEPINYRESILTRRHKTIFSKPTNTAVHALSLFLGNSPS